MKLEGVVFLAANTARSRSYAQSLEARGHTISSAILFDRRDTYQPGKSGMPTKPTAETSIVLPDLAIPLKSTCDTICENVESVEADTVNDNAVVSLFKNAVASGAELVIFSGFGGQLVGADLLGIGVPFLHIHSGWLPGYRGSTTIYYSLLNGDACGVSAILLDSRIDQGPVVARRSYPPPPSSVDIDFFYDSAIRADLMADTVEAWSRTGGFEAPIAQPEVDEGAFFVIHPLLKHVALLALREESADRAPS